MEGGGYGPELCQSQQILTQVKLKINEEKKIAMALQTEADVNFK